MEIKRHNTLKDFKPVLCEDVCPHSCVGREELKKELREEAIKWIKSFNGEPPSELEDNATWETITDIKRIQGYSADDYKLELAVKWGIEEGAILMLMKFFNIREEDLNLLSIEENMRSDVEDERKGRGGKRRKIITLCGSTKFRKEYEETNAELTLAGNIVLSVGLFGKVNGDTGKETNITLTIQQKELLDKIHFAKIDICDEIFVLDVGGYIGESTEKEINYARQMGKQVKFYSNKSW